MTSKNTSWTQHQIDCLNALGIPLYARKIPARGLNLESGQTVRPMLRPMQDASPGHASVQYVLGPWRFACGERLPVELYPWLHDLSAFVQGSLAEVKTEPSQAAMDISKWCKPVLDAQEKRALWSTLQAALQGGQNPSANGNSQNTPEVPHAQKQHN